MPGDAHTAVAADMAGMAIGTPREGIKDIDAADVDDPLAVCEYVDGIYDHLRAYEVRYCTYFVPAYALCH